MYKKEKKKKSAQNGSSQSHLSRRHYCFLKLRRKVCKGRWKGERKRKRNRKLRNDPHKCQPWVSVRSLLLPLLIYPVRRGRRRRRREERHSFTASHTRLIYGHRFEQPLSAPPPPRERGHQLTASNNTGH